MIKIVHELIKYKTHKSSCVGPMKGLSLPASQPHVSNSTRLEFAIIFNSVGICNIFQMNSRICFFLSNQTEGVQLCKIITAVVTCCSNVPQETTLSYHITQLAQTGFTHKGAALPVQDESCSFGDTCQEGSRVSGHAHALVSRYWCRST